MANILVVQYYDLLLLAIRDVLEVEGHTVFIAKDGIEGWTALQQHPVDLMISKYSMPRMDGWELLERLRADLRYIDLPFIIISGRNARETFLAHGANAYLSMPFDPQDLVDTVNRVLDGKYDRPLDARFTRAREVLEGLSVGDAFGDRLFFQNFSLSDTDYGQIIRDRVLPSPRWPYTDDTQMALSIVDVLYQYGEIDQDALAKSFAQHFDHKRGYGPGMYKLIPQLQRGVPWKKAAHSLFDGQGSYGNGGAMRVAPVGGFFADDLAAVVENARRSAEVTHAHPEASAGAIAVAVATAIACQLRNASQLFKERAFIEKILPHIPESEVREGVCKAAALPTETDIDQVVLEIGNGTWVTAQDTVPYVLWCAAQHLDSYEHALWLTASGIGDFDTNCAMVGGIVAGYVGLEGIPTQWRRYCEALPTWPFFLES